MRKKIWELTCILLLFLLIPSVNAQTLGELKAELQNKIKEKEKNDQQSEEAKKEIAEKEAALKKAEQEIHTAEEEEQRVQEEITKSNEQMEESKKKIEEKKKSIEETNKKIEEQTEEVKKMLLYLQQVKSENAYVEYVSGASTLTEMINRINGLELLTKHIQETMDSLEADVKKLETEKKELEEEVEKLEQEIKRNEQLKEELIEKQKELEKQAETYKKAIEARHGDIANYDQFALNIDKQVDQLKSLVNTYTKNCAKYAPEKGDSAELSIDCVEKKTNSNGGHVIENEGWLKPLTSGIVTSPIGSRWGSYHNALDIGGPSPFEGTPVYAAAAGVVSGKISRYSCGGNMLYINVMVNGVEYTTYYYHLLKFNVEVGDVVTQNTVIGWVGGYSTSASHGGYDTCTTGAHLHFGVAKGFYNGYSIPRGNVIIPPGFPNYSGYRFTSRYDMY